MDDVELSEKIAKYLAPFVWDYDPEWLKEHPEIEKERNKQRERADQILALIKETGYLPVEPVKLEVLTDEELHKADNKLGEDFYRAEDPEAWLMDRRNISEATIVHNEAKGRLYRMKK